MKNKLILAISLLVLTAQFSSTTYAEDPNKTRAEFKAKLAKMAGPLGPFARSEDFPKSYFLIPQNLPFMVGLSLHHPMSPSLKLTDEQKAGINKIKKVTVPVVAKAGKQIKEKEVALAQAFIDGASVADMEKLVDEISALQTDLTKKHLICIHQVREILTPEQFKTLQGYAGGKPK
ncbi:MAG TPA: hypothetical protein EYH38_07575 [Leucothrix sp.]|nr:hypothetical protein [Leucothrix sp.]